MITLNIIFKSESLFTIFSRLENHFQPANEQIHFKPLSIRFFYLVKPSYSNFRSLFVIVAKAKSPILSFKICEELSAVQTPEKEQIRDNKTRLFMS